MEIQCYNQFPTDKPALASTPAETAKPTLFRRILLHASALVLLLGAAKALSTSMTSSKLNSGEPGTVSLYAYSDSFLPKKERQVLDELPLAYLSGFEPFRKYEAALEYLSNKDPGKKTASFIGPDTVKRTVKAVFYDLDYFLYLQQQWYSKKPLYILDQHLDNFVTMVKFANEPFIATKENMILGKGDVYMILGLYEIFALNDTERTTATIKEETGVDLTKREVFKENIRTLLQNSEDALENLTGLLRDIRYNRRNTLMAEAPSGAIQSSKWVGWMLAREENKDLFWYLFSTLCNTYKDFKRYRGVLTYVSEGFIMGKKGIKLYVYQTGNPSPVGVTLSEYLLYRTPLDVRRIQIEIEEGLKVPEMQFSAILDVFSSVSLIYIKSLGNCKRVDRNLPLLNIILDHEKKKKESGTLSHLEGVILHDSTSINEFAKKQFTSLDFTSVGFMTKQQRSKCCVDLTNGSLTPTENRSPNFFGVFSIPHKNRGEIKQLVAPYKMFFPDNLLPKLPALEEINISINDPVLDEASHGSELATDLRNVMRVNTVRLHGESREAESSYPDILRKVLKIHSVKTLDVSDLELRTDHLISLLESSENELREGLRVFSFKYSEREVADSSNITGGVPGLLERIMDAFPNIETLNVRIETSSPSIYNLVRDIKYLMRCSNERTRDQVKKILQINYVVPIAFTEEKECTDILAQNLHELKLVIEEITKGAKECPNDHPSGPLREMTKGELHLDLKDIMKKTVCPAL